MIIYKARNKINEKIYIGKTIHSLELRIAQHLRPKVKQLFSRAIHKYGIQNFEFSTIDQASSVEVLDAKECYWIMQYNCKVPNGYNLTDGGDGLCNPSEEIRRKRSQALKGRCLTEEHRRKISEANIGKHSPSEETRNKWSEARKGKPKTEETRRKIGEANAGEKNYRWRKPSLSAINQHLIFLLRNLRDPEKCQRESGGGP